MSYTIDPLLPVGFLVALACGAALASIVRFRATPFGSVLRLLASASALLFLLGPEQIIQNTDRLKDQVLVLSDESASMELGDRPAALAEAREKLLEKIEEFGADVVTAGFGDETTSDLRDGLSSALASTDRGQLAGIFVLTDGQVEGADDTLLKDLPAPLHTLLVGEENKERDRRLSWVSAPRFSLVGEPTRLQFRVDDSTGSAAVPLTLRVDGEEILTREVAVGEVVSVRVPLDRPGERIVDVSVPTATGELSTRNNAITTKINVIRDRLRVLLISGEPHAGERVWRNVLKSDPAVDLVHFTILKPADKIAAASEQELNLIPFPSRQLFLEKLKHFNVVIFDRYTYRGVISSFELAEVARYVERGGAVLIAAGPELARDGSLAAQPNLAYILPALPVGLADDTTFVPKRTIMGQRHPITAPLEGSDDWGRWLRHIPADARRGQVLMEAGEGRPLLVTQRVDEGRIAMLLSDHLWLWARGFDGGGPHREFLRRLVHWLMAEPELEEEALRASLADDGTLTILRRSLSDDVAPVRIVPAIGDPLDVTLERQGEGFFSASVPDVAGDSVRLQTYAGAGRSLTAAALRERGASREFAAVTATDALMREASQRTGGGVFWTGRNAAQDLDLRTVRRDRARKAGKNWAGLTPRNAEVILSEARGDALPRWAYLLLASGLLLAAWLTESGRLSFQARSSAKIEG